MDPETIWEDRQKLLKGTCSPASQMMNEEVFDEKGEAHKRELIVEINGKYYNRQGKQCSKNGKDII